jgi:hypothetical protein
VPDNQVWYGMPAKYYRDVHGAASPAGATPAQASTPAPVMPARKPAAAEEPAKGSDSAHAGLRQEEGLVDHI